MTPLAPLAWLSNLLLEIGGLLLLVMMVHVCADVGMKYLFNRPIQGTLEIVSYYYMVGAVFLPIAFVELTRGAVSVDLFFAMMPRWMQVGCLFLVLALCAGAYALLATITWADALRAHARGEVVMGPISVVIWPSRFVLPASFGLGALVCAIHALRLLSSPRARAALLLGQADGGTV
jgi:TRAP-type C4-dicarboxylate transport system permease small subunit